MIELYSKVKILHSPHPDIAPGMKGVVVEQKGTGWAVQISAKFKHANPIEKGIEETRVIWFEDKELEEI